jgi:arylsulfatase A-like enzyme
VRRAIADLRHWPKIQWVTFSSLDGYQHIHGTDAGYPAVLRAIDREIGRYREESRRLGQEPYRIYAVLSDHGVAEADVNLDLRTILADCCGLRAVRDQATRFRASSLAVPLSEYDGADAVVVVNGNMLNYVHLRDPGAAAGTEWRRPLSAAELSAYGPRGVDLIDGLRRAAGIEMVIVRGDRPGRVQVHGPAGRGELVSDGRAIAYRAEGGDPLGYAALGLADGRPRLPREWLAATHGANYPDAPYRLVALMANEDAGDLVVTSAPGHDLGAGYELLVGSYRGGHGGLRADQLRVPYVLAGPGVAPGARVGAARAEDVGVTLMALLGLAPEDGADGRLLREALAFSSTTSR